jgi:type IV pilus assembly protein PilC
MANYTYQAVSRSTGLTTSGVVNAEAIEDARSQLKSQGLLVVELHEGRSAVGKKEITIGGDKVKLKDVAWAARNLATTQTAGLPIPRALKMLGNQRAGEGIGKVLLRIQDDVIGGRSLAEAFAQEEEHLGKMTSAMVAAGESSGKLHESLTKLADLCEARVRLKRKIVSALTYPAVMMVLVITIFFVMLIVVVPTFKNIYDQLGGELPALTALMMGLSDLIRGHILWGPVVIFGSVFGFKKLKKSKKFRLIKDKVVFKLPMFGSLFLSSAVARMATTLSSSLGAGVQLLDSLQLAGEVAGNSIFEDAIGEIRNDVRDGKSLGNAMSRQPVVPDMFTSLVMIGEETGALDDLLFKYAEILEEEVETRVEGITSVIEPIMIMVFGGLVGVMVVSLYLPIINIFKFLK